ncbi:hypothetical protein HYU18_04090 [Candidatus Woesearchaeota archaeon]|nr:hypothetical protein [Candidatus Woesearchaeota archaeon]
MARKKIGMFWAAACAILAFASTFNAALAATDNPIAEESSFIVATLVNQNPDPAEPGDLVELKIRLENKGSKPAQDVIVELIPTYPVIIPEGEKTKNAGTILGRQTGTDAVLARYFLTIDSAAGTGSSPLSIRYKAASSAGWIVLKDVFNISIRQRDLPLSITRVRQQPENLVPGKSANITLTAENFGTSEAINIRVRLNLTESTPIATYGSTNEAFIPLVNAKGKTETSFQIITNPEAKSGLYKVPIQVTYSDRSGRNYTLGAQSFGILIGAASSFSAAVVGTDIIKYGSRQRITIEIVNSGLGDVKLLTARLAKSSSYDVISQETTYIGDLDSGDSETVTYDIIPRSEGPLVLNLELSDALNNKHEERVEVPVKIYTGSEASRLGLEKSRGKGLIIILAIVAIGVLAYRKLRKKK